LKVLHYASTILEQAKGNAAYSSKSGRFSMNIFSGIASGIKAGIRIADGLGMCKGCHIRKSGMVDFCMSCDADLCDKCNESMVKKYLWKAERDSLGFPPFAYLSCEACGGKYGTHPVIGIIQKKAAKSKQAMMEKARELLKEY
jgi:hypothetical protein